MQGKIIKGIAGFYYIYAENDEIYECKAKGIFRKDKQKPLVGDNVEIEVLDEQEKEGSESSWCRIGGKYFLSYSKDHYQDCG